MNSACFDISDAILSLHGIALWCAISGVICVIDGDTHQLIISPSDNPPFQDEA